MSDFAIRPMSPSDEPFIYKAWLRGYWEHFPGRVIVSEAEFMERWHRVVERILADKRTVTVVAHVEGEPDALLGFACFKGGIDGDGLALHWAYVKQAFRGLGICSGMLSGVRLHRIISHWPGSDLGEWHFYPELLKEYAE